VVDGGGGGTVREAGVKDTYCTGMAWYRAPGALGTVLRRTF